VRVIDNFARRMPVCLQFGAHFVKNITIICKLNKQYTNKQFAEIRLDLLNISMSLMSIIFERVHWTITKNKNKTKTKYISFVDI
jgi:hypothetical protein